jgi:fucose permease
VSVSKASLIVITLSYLAFVSIGLPDGLLGVAWPSIRSHFHLPVQALGTLLLLFTFGYLVSSFYNGWLLARMTVGTLLVLSCLATGASLIAYAMAPSWWSLVLFGNVAGLGAGAIDAGLNTFAAKNFSHRTINWLHAAYGAGTSAGPYLLTALLVRGFPWQSGYAIVGISQLILALCFVLTLRHWKTDQDEEVASVKRSSLMQTLQLPAVWLSIAVFFVYTGLEAAAGLWTYSLLTEARNLPIKTAGLWVSIYWVTFTIGRFLSGFIAEHIQARAYLRICIAGIILGAAFLWLNISNITSLAGLAMMGLFCAPIFPTMIATTPARLGNTNASNAIGFQIAAATISWALIPAFLGVMAGKSGLNLIAPALLVITVVLFLLHEAFLLIVSQNKDREVVPAA